MTYSVNTTATQSGITSPSAAFNQAGLSLEKAEELFQAITDFYNLDNSTAGFEPLVRYAGGRGYDVQVELNKEV